ncbi:hypothetical protein AS888_01650 [Peribacillus simplex]|uniref:Glycosyl-4,4'-diaponeurosporenoate acyltransferase n=1 Tax=Peribacillus simplex TaxID=1478 RepID=A0A125QQZ7_9BACI|nr:hypothetical protein AS888_01650 [Peribacillus simplex]
MVHHWIMILDIVAWCFFHMGMGISLCTVNIPNHHSRITILYSGLKGEKWKNYIPDGSKIIKRGFEKKQLQGTDTISLTKVMLETKRAESTHWFSIFPAGFFFVWNPVWAGWIMVVYTISFNIPIIIVQRYNFARWQQLLAKKN